MGKRLYRTVNPRQKRPKGHDVVCDDEDNCPDISDGEKFFYRTEMNIYYPRTGDTQTKATPTTEKIRNLFLFALESGGDPDCIDPQAFCEWREISMSNFRRLLTIMREYYGCYSETGNTYHDTPMNRKYLALLALHDRLEDGVDMKSFCAEFHIGRTTFYRYLAHIGDFYGEYKVISLLGDGRYVIVELENIIDRSMD